MDLEMSCSERYAASIKQFEGAFDELTKRTLEALSAFFGKLRELEAQYHENVVNAALEILEQVMSS